MKKNPILILIVLLFYACNEKKSINKMIKQEVNIKDVDTLNPIKENNENFVIATIDYDFEADYYGLNLIDYELIGNSLNSNIRKLSFGKYKDVLMSGKYNSMGAYYPIQFDFSNNKMYFSIYKADEMEGEFYYNKILEYNLNNDSIREIISFSDYLNSWYLSTVNRKIYSFDNTGKTIISVDLLNSIVDTLYKFTSYFDEIDYYPINKDYLNIITSNKDIGVIKFKVNLKTNEISKTEICHPTTSSTSYNNGVVVETFKDYNNYIEELRIYNHSERKSIPYNFKNFNVFWISDSNFVAIKENEIQKINLDLEVVNVFKKRRIHIIDVVKNLILISYYEDKDEKVGLLNYDFKNLIEIPNIKASDIVVIKNK